MLLTLLVLAIGALLTFFSILDRRYQLEHYAPALDIKVAPVALESSYAIPAKIMGNLSLLVPFFATIGLSLSYFRTANGQAVRRYAKAFGLSVLLLPLMALQYLPWTLYQVRQTPDYLQFDEFQFVLALLPIYVAFAVLLSLGVNAIAWLRERRGAPDA